MKEREKKAMKVAILGAEALGRTTLTEALKLNKTVLVIAGDNDGIFTKYKEKEIPIERLMPHEYYFTPPITRRERRKAERKKNKVK